MIPDVDIKSYYLQYVGNANSDIVKYKESLEQTVKLKDSLYNYLLPTIDSIKESYSIDIASHEKEWKDKAFNEAQTLYFKLIKLFNISDDSDSNKINLIQAIKYCNILKVEDKYIRLINLAKTRKSMKYSAYVEYVRKYYNQVHKVVLTGMGYRFGYGIGTYCINHWKIDPERMRKKNVIDFAATNARKKELIAKGAKLYNEYEAEFYRARKIPYDGVDYRIYKRESSFYEFTFIKSIIFKSSTLDYQRNEYVAAEFRGMSYTDIADRHCKTIDDVYSLKLDIKYKLNIILYKDPNKYLNFIRNAEQCKYQRGAHNS